MKTYRKVAIIVSALGVVLAPVVANAMACRSCSRAECQQLADKYSHGHMHFTGAGSCTYAHGGTGSATVALNFEDAVKKSEAISMRAGDAVSSQKLMKEEPGRVLKALPLTK